MEVPHGAGVNQLITVHTCMLFYSQADPPDPNKIPREDVVGVTVVLLTCSYNGQEFIRVGYYVNNEYPESELKENPPIEPDFKKVGIIKTTPWSWISKSVD